MLQQVAPHLPSNGLGASHTTNLACWRSRARNSLVGMDHRTRGSYAGPVGYRRNSVNPCPGASVFTLDGAADLRHRPGKQACSGATAAMMQGRLAGFRVRRTERFSTCTGSNLGAMGVRSRMTQWTPANHSDTAADFLRSGTVDVLQALPRHTYNFARSRYVSHGLTSDLRR